MRFRYYLLDAHKRPVGINDAKQWGAWFETADRHVAHDTIGDVRISTVFLGLDHSFGMGTLPVLFETMIFGGEHDQYCDRYCTYEEALEGHAKALNLVGPAKVQRRGIAIEGTS